MVAGNGETRVGLKENKIKRVEFLREEERSGWVLSV